MSDAGGGGDQDWWGLLYLFLAGMVTVSIDMVRRLSIHLSNLLNDAWERHEESQIHEHRRCGEIEPQPHRRHDDPVDNEEDQA